MIADLRYAARMLLKSPGFSFIAILTLALCLGANASIFSVINAVLLRPLPYPQPDRLVVLNETDIDQPRVSVALLDILDWRKDNRVFSDLAIARRESFNLNGLSGREPEQISGALVTANFFNVIGLQPQIGRTFDESEDRAGGPALVVISDELWTRVFQRDRAILGRSIDLAGEPYTVIGVMPRQMASPRAVEAWFPIMRRATVAEWQSRGNHPGLFGWGRLKAGVTVPQAQSDLNRIATRLAHDYPDTNSETGVKVTDLLENQVGDYRASLLLLLAAVGLVLLIGCANLANLLAARGAARSREFAIRVAIGASRWQIIRQLLIESVVLTGLGCALGLCFAAWGRDLLVTFSPTDVQRFQEVRLDFRVVAFTGLLAAVTSIAFGLWPAWRASRADAQQALKAGVHGSSDAPAERRSREFLVVLEVALGFEPHNLVTARIDLPSPGYDDPSKLITFSKTLVEKLNGIPGVQRASLGANPPLMTGWQTAFLPEGAPEPPPGQLPSAEMNAVTGDYFQTLQTSISRGRDFQSHDTRETPRVVIIDQLMADKYFHGENPIGKRLRMNVDSGGRQMRTIIGVVPHLKVYGFDETTSLPQAYVPQTQAPNPSLVILLRTSLQIGVLEKTVREIVGSLDPAQPVFEFRTMQDRVAETWSTPRLMTSLLGIFSALALTLAVVGLYGVMAYNGLRRTREIGVRLALGARRGQVAGLILRRGMSLLVVGLVLGVGSAIALAHLIRSMLFHVSAADPSIYLVVILLLAAAAAMACWIPARRASRVDPVVTLRSE